MIQRFSNRRQPPFSQDSPNWQSQACPHILGETRAAIKCELEIVSPDYLVSLSFVVYDTGSAIYLPGNLSTI